MSLYISFLKQPRLFAPRIILKGFRTNCKNALALKYLPQCQFVDVPKSQSSPRDYWVRLLLASISGGLRQLALLMSMVYKFPWHLDE